MSANLKVLIVGGYGNFGGRLAALLAHEPRVTVIIAGRSLDRARAFCEAARPSAKATLSPAGFDRARDPEAGLAVLGPDIVVDASGPFQAYGDRRYALIEACIARRVHYLDLADGSEFVVGVRDYDDRARAAGVYILSGLSTCPALTAAVVRRLSFDMPRVIDIRAGIAPSPHADIGKNVVRAIAGYAGRRATLMRNGKRIVGYPFTEHMRVTIDPPGQTPLPSKMFSLVDAPELLALTELWPEAANIWIGAGPVPEILHRLLIGLAWLVRIRLIPSLAPLAGIMHAAMRILRWGEHRGGMFIDVEGEDVTGTPVARSWRLIAEGDDGPFIPAMAAAALILKAANARAPDPGARAALRDVELTDYEALFETRKISTGVREELPVDAPLYERLLGPAWKMLPVEIRAMHRVTGPRFAEGRATVVRGRGLIARFAASIVGFPSSGEDMPVTVHFACQDGHETWTRRFGDDTFLSSQFAGTGRSAGLLRERFGPLVFAMAPVVDDGVLRLVPRRWTAFGLPLALRLGPRCTAHESVEDGRFHFHVEISHPIAGLIVRYRGWLNPVPVG